MSIDKLSEEVVEEGKSHPFVQALFMELVRKQQELANRLALLAANGEPDRVMWPLGGRMAELAAVIKLISTARGGEEE